MADEKNEQNFHLSHNNSANTPIPNTMPSWSYIPYTSLPPKYEAKEPQAAFHSAFAGAAYKRIRQTLIQEFHGQCSEKLRFLTNMVEGVLRNKNGKRAYLIVLEAFGKPLFVVRNLAHTLQDPVDRGVYMVHLEDALQIWQERQEGFCWEALLLVGIAGIVGYGFSSLFQSSWLPVHPNIRPHALIHFFS